MPGSFTEEPTARTTPGVVATAMPEERTIVGPFQGIVQRIAGLVDASRGIIPLSAAQVGTTAITSALGFVYWWTAARLLAPSVVGFGAAATSAMLLLGTLSVSGLSTELIKQLPNHPQQHGSLLLSAGLLVAALAGLFGFIVSVTFPRFSAALRPLDANWGTVLLFSAGVSMTAVAILVDQAVLGLLRERVQVLRNTIFAATKLAVLAGLAIWAMVSPSLSGLGLYAIYASWLVGNVVSLMVLILAFGRPTTSRAIRPDWSLLRSMGPGAIAHHLLNLTFLASSLLLPVVVAWLLSTTANAYFYTAWMLAGFVGTVPFTLTVSLFAVSASDPGRLAQKIRFTLLVALLVASLANIVIFIGAHLILSVFGASYAASGTWILRIFGLAVFPLIIKDHYLALQRIGGRVARAVPVMALCGVLEIGLATVGALLGGLQGLSIAWLVAVSLEGVLMAPTVLRAMAMPSPQRRLSPKT